MRVALQAVLLALFFGAALSAEVITGVTIESFSGEAVTTGWDLRAVHLVDGSGLAGNVHGSCYAGDTCWQNGFPGAVPASLVFDLEGSYTLSSMHIWNGYWANDESARSANEVVISTSLNNSDWVNQGTYQFAMAPDNNAAPYTGFEISGLSWANTHYVRFTINSNFGGGTCVGCLVLSEVQFTGDGDRVRRDKPACCRG